MSAIHPTHPTHGIDFEDGSAEDVRVSKVFTTPKGNQLRAVIMGSSVVLKNVKDTNGGTIILTGGTGGAVFSIAGFLGGLADDLLDGLDKVIKVIKGAGCTPVSNASVEFDKDGKVTKVSTSSACVPN